MHLFTISDLHLSLSADKPMNVFHGWDNYVERIEANWRRLVSDDDTVVIPGDISWALKLEDSVKDLKFIDDLPGKKIILKGNHDLWWGTMSKLTAFLSENDIKTITPLYNSHIKIGNTGICGSRGWLCDGTAESDKILAREAGRLETSIKSALLENLKPEVFMHYPPVYADQCSEKIVDVLKKYGIKRVFHGHIHGSGLHRAVKYHYGIEYFLVSCDCIEFTPYKIMPETDR